MPHALPERGALSASRLHADFERGDPGQVDVETLFDNDGDDFSFDFDS